MTGHRRHFGQTVHGDGLLTHIVRVENKFGEEAAANFVGERQM